MKARGTAVRQRCPFRCSFQGISGEKILSQPPDRRGCHTAFLYQYIEFPLQCRHLGLCGHSVLCYRDFSQLRIHKYLEYGGKQARRKPEKIQLGRSRFDSQPPPTRHTLPPY